MPGPFSIETQVAIERATMRASALSDADRETIDEVRTLSSQSFKGLSAPQLAGCVRSLLAIIDRGA